MTNKKDVEFEIKKFTDRVGMERKVGDITREEIQELVDKIVNKHKVDSNKCKTCKNFKAVDDSLFCEHSLDCGIEGKNYEEDLDKDIELKDAILEITSGKLLTVILKNSTSNFFIKSKDVNINIAFVYGQGIDITTWRDEGHKEIKFIKFESITKDTKKILELVKTKDKFNKCPIFKMLKDGCLECPNADETCLLLKPNEG